MNHFCTPIRPQQDKTEHHSGMSDEEGQVDAVEAPEIPADSAAPEIPAAAVNEQEKTWDRIEDGPFDADVNEDVPPPDEEVIINAESDEIAQVPREIPPPPLPHPAVRRRHRLTHMPYASWCRHCVEGRRNNTAHKSVKDKTRTVPCLTLDYCFLRDKKGDDNLKVAFGKFVPSQATFACGAEVKGADEYVTARLKDFIKSQGADHFVYKTDQEAALRTCIEESLKQLNRHAADAKTAVPENSAVGESQSNGMAKKHV